ncbi:MAG: T9SS type A sorting domain-containing protein [Paludibacter sp.]
MKQLILTIVFFAFAFTSKAQINLEHTFSVNNGSSLSCFYTNTKGTMFYITPDTLTNQLKIYNTDYSLYKNITIPRQIGYSMNVLFLSEQLFNSNTSIEFVCLFLKYQTSGTLTKIVVYDENGAVLKDFGTYNQYVFPFLSNYNGGTTKLILIKYDSSITPTAYDIYSLTGTLPNKVPETSISDVQSAYPNPSKSIITLPYKLENNKTTVMNIYKLNSQMVDSKQIDSSFDKIQLNVNSYQPGVYIYEYNGVSNKFIVQ